MKGFYIQQTTQGLNLCGLLYTYTFLTYSGTINDMHIAVSSSF